MSIKDKILQAENTTWVTDGMSDAEIKTTIELARISAKIESCRLDMGESKVSTPKSSPISKNVRG